MKKDHILEVALKLELDVRRSMRKTQLMKVVAEDMVDYDIFDKSVLDDLASDLPELSKVQIELEKLKIEAQIELARINQETRFKELEAERTRREKERNNFDLTKHIRLVPAFNEEDVDKYFQHFEKNRFESRVAYRSMADVTTDSIKRQSAGNVCFPFNYRQRQLQHCKNGNFKKL